MNKEAKKRVEEMLYSFENTKKQIVEIKRLTEATDVEPTERGLLISLGLKPSMRIKTEPELEFLEDYLKTKEMDGYEYGVPCHNHVSNSSTCAVYGFHMSKCPLLNEAERCPSLDIGIPVVSIFEERASQHLNFHYAELLNDLADYLSNSELPPASLMTALGSIKKDFRNVNSEGYINVLLDRNKVKPSSNRKPIPASLRFEVLKSHNFACIYCGRTPTDGIKLHIDHVLPVAKGGTNEIENLVVACQDCNLGKSDRKLDE